MSIIKTSFIDAITGLFFIKKSTLHAAAAVGAALTNSLLNDATAATATSIMSQSDRQAMLMKAIIRQGENQMSTAVDAAQAGKNILDQMKRNL